MAKKSYEQIANDFYVHLLQVAEEDSTPPHYEPSDDDDDDDEDPEPPSKIQKQQ